MQANYKAPRPSKHLEALKLKQAAKDAVTIEAAEYTDRMYSEISKDIVAQVMAVCIKELALEFSFGKARLKRFYSGVATLFMLMETGVLGKPFNTIDTANTIKEQYDIDVFNDKS